jgi:hypothetical protein
MSLLTSSSLLSLLLLSWLYSPLLGLCSFFSLLNLYTVGRTPRTGDQPVARPLPARRTQTQTSMPWVGFELTIPAFEGAKTVHALGGGATVIGPCLHTALKYRECQSTNHMPLSFLNNVTRSTVPKKWNGLFDMRCQYSKRPEADRRADAYLGRDSMLCVRVKTPTTGRRGTVNFDINTQLFTGR